MGEGALWEVGMQELTVCRNGGLAWLLRPMEVLAKGKVPLPWMRSMTRAPPAGRSRAKSTAAGWAATRSLRARRVAVMAVRIFMVPVIS